VLRNRVERKTEEENRSSSS